MQIVKIDIRPGRDAYYVISRIYHTLTDVRFWLASAFTVIWLYMFGV